MGRPREEGVYYFPVDVDIFGNRKIRALRARFGSDGPQFYLYLLCEIYRGKGYYLQMDDYFQETAAAELGCDPEKIGMMLHFLTKGSLLLESISSAQGKVLTSRGIQRRFQQMKTRAGQWKPISVNERFWLLDEEETETFIEVRQIEDSSHKNDRSSYRNGHSRHKNATKKRKGNESKVNESKGEESEAAEKSAAAAPTALPEQFGKLSLPLPPNAEKEISFYLQQGMTQALIEWAADEAASRGKPWDYARAILRAKLAKGIRDVSQLGADRLLGAEPLLGADRLLGAGRKKKAAGSGFAASYDIEEFEQQGFTLPEGWEGGG